MRPYRSWWVCLGVYEELVVRLGIERAHPAWGQRSLLVFHGSPSLHGNAIAIYARARPVCGHTRNTRRRFCRRAAGGAFIGRWGLMGVMCARHCGWRQGVCEGRIDVQEFMRRV